MAGRRPKPTRIKEIEGNPGKRALNREEPQPEPSIPECPPHLDDEAKAEWNRIAPELLRLKLMANVFRASLAAYCQAYSRWVRAESKLKETSEVIRTAKGYPITNPYLGISNRVQEMMHKFATEFGLTPSSLSRIHGSTEIPEDSKAKADPWQDFVPQTTQ